MYIIWVLIEYMIIFIVFVLFILFSFFFFCLFVLIIWLLFIVVSELEKCGGVLEGVWVWILIGVEELLIFGVVVDGI